MTFNFDDLIQCAVSFNSASDSVFRKIRAVCDGAGLKTKQLTTQDTEILVKITRPATDHSGWADLFQKIRALCEEARLKITLLNTKSTEMQVKIASTGLSDSIRHFRQLIRQRRIIGCIGAGLSLCDDSSSPRSFDELFFKS